MFLKIHGSIRSFTMQEFSGKMKTAYRQLWKDVITGILTDILESLPSHTGDTIRAFADVARKYKVPLPPNGRNPNYDWWDGWDHERGHDFSPVQVFLKTHTAGEVAGFSQFDLTDLPATFDYNEREGTNYVKYWLKGAKQPWTPKSQFRLPWDMLKDAKYYAVARLRRETPIVFQQAIRVLLKHRIDYRHGSRSEGVEE